MSSTRDEAKDSTSTSKPSKSSYSSWPEKRNAYQDQDWSSNKKQFIKYSDVIGPIKSLTSLKSSTSSVVCTTTISTSSTTAKLSNILKNLKQTSDSPSNAKPTSSTELETKKESVATSASVDNSSSKGTKVPKSATASIKAEASTPSTNDSTTNSMTTSAMQAMKDVQRAIDAARGVRQDSAITVKQEVAAADNSKTTSDKKSAGSVSRPGSPVPMDIDELDSSSPQPIVSPQTQPTLVSSPTHADASQKGASVQTVDELRKHFPFLDSNPNLASASSASDQKDSSRNAKPSDTHFTQSDRSFVGDPRTKRTPYFQASTHYNDPRRRAHSVEPNRFHQPQAALKIRHRVELSVDYQGDTFSDDYDCKDYNREFRESARYNESDRMSHYGSRSRYPFRPRRSMAWSPKYTTGDSDFVNAMSAPIITFTHDPRNDPRIDAFYPRQASHYDLPSARGEGFREFSNNYELNYRNSVPWNTNTNDNKESPGLQSFVNPSVWGGVITYNLLHSPRSLNTPYQSIPEKRIF